MPRSPLKPTSRSARLSRGEHRTVPRCGCRPFADRSHCQVSVPIPSPRLVPVVDHRGTRIFTTTTTLSHSAKQLSPVRPMARTTITTITITITTQGGTISGSISPPGNAGVRLGKARAANEVGASVYIGLLSCSYFASGRGCGDRSRRYK